MRVSHLLLILTWDGQRRVLDIGSLLVQVSAGEGPS